MGTYRKKPVVVEAIRYEQPDQPRTGGNIDELQAWGVKVEPVVLWDPPTHGDIRVYNSSHDDWNLTHPGDWIIKGTSGEIYPCEPGIFEATYEPVEVEVVSEVIGFVEIHSHVWDPLNSIGTAPHRTYKCQFPGCGEIGYEDSLT